MKPLEDAKVKLLEEQLNHAKQPKVVKQSASTGIEYNVELRKMVREIRKDINAQLVPILRATQREYIADGYVDDITAVLQRVAAKWSSQQFNMLAAQLARRFVTTADRINRDRFGKTIRSIGIDVYTDAPEITDYLAASVYDNTQLIKSIPAQYLERVESIVMTNVRSGNRSSAIVQQLSKQFGVTEKRAKMIARDQTAKINGQLVEKRQTAVGFEYFQWLDSDDERVRDRHDELANRVTAYGKGIYRWDNPPFSDSGQPIIPGADYGGCRCNARPVSQREVDENVKAGRTRPGVKR